MLMDLNRLRLACRRGMWELDILFEGFLDQGYSALTLEEKKLFEELLQCQDPDLFSWLMLESVPQNPAFIPLLEKIKIHGKTALS